MDLARYAAKYDPTEAFAQLSDPDPAVRLVGAKWVAKHAHGEVNRFTEVWLKDVATTDRLLPLLADPDPLVVEQLAGAANMIVARYRKDDRFVAPAVALLRSARPNTRVRAAMLLTNFDDPALADVLLPLLTDPDKTVRAVVAAEVGRPAAGWPPGHQERVRRAALDRLGDRVVEVRCNAASLLVVVGQAGDVAVVKAGLKEVKGVNYRQDYRESIKLLDARFAVGKRAASGADAAG
jgi:HEAT repeat protein